MLYIILIVTCTEHFIISLRESKKVNPRLCKPGALTHKTCGVSGETVNAENGIAILTRGEV